MTTKNKSETMRWGKSVQSRDEQHQLKRMAILRTAGNLFNRNGFRETSLNDLALELQVTKPTLYYYVENKEDILYQCLLTAITQLLEQSSEVLKAPIVGIEKFKRFIHLFTSIFDDEFGRCLAHPGPEPLSSKYQKKIEPLYVKVDSVLRDILTFGIGDGSIRQCDPKITCFAIFGAMNWMTKWYQIDGPMTTQQIAKEMVSLFEKGLTPTTA